MIIDFKSDLPLLILSIVLTSMLYFAYDAHTTRQKEKLLKEATVMTNIDTKILSIKQVYLINGKLFSTETLSTMNNLDLLKEIGVQVEVKDVL